MSLHNVASEYRQLEHVTAKLNESTTREHHNQVNGIEIEEELKNLGRLWLAYIRTSGRVFHATT